MTINADDVATVIKTLGAILVSFISKRLRFRPIQMFTLLFFLAPSAFGGVVKGNIERTWTDAGYVYIRGWACHQGINQSTNVHLYLGGSAGRGTMVAAARANVANESAVNRACGTSTARHRFQFKLTKHSMLPHRGKSIYVHGIKLNNTSANNLLNKSGQLSIDKFPNQSVIGYGGSVFESGDNIIFTGWTCQPNVKQELAVHIYVGGTNIAQGRTTQSHEQGVTNHCGNTGKRHRYKISVPKSQLAAHRGKGVYPYGLSAVPGYPNRRLLNGGRYSIPNFTQRMNLSQVPKTNGDTIIPAGVEAVLDGDYVTGLLRINGKLTCPTTGNHSIRATAIVVAGELNCGTNANPVVGRIKFRLRGNRRIQMPMTMNGMTMNHDMGIKTFAVINGGKVRMHGHKGKSFWVHLSKQADNTSNVIELTSGVNWRAGDQIAIAPSDFDFTQSEEFTITERIASNKYRLNRKPTYVHTGVNKSYSNGSQSWVLKSRAEVGNLTRHIVIETEGDVTSNSVPEANRYIGAHMMVMRGGLAQIEAVEFNRMGQAGEMARYPFHWHRAGNVNGQFIRDSSVHHSFQRCITVHGTNHALVHNNVCYDHRGHGIFLEDGNEVYNQISNNLVINSKRAYRGRALLESDYRFYNGNTSTPTTGFKMRRFSPPASYWISNPKNNVVNNVAAGSHGTGFWMSFEDRRICNPDECSNPARTNTMAFNNNLARGVDVGMTWDGARGTVSPNNPNNPDDRKLENVLYSPPNMPTFTGNQVIKAKHSAFYTRSQPLNFSRTVSSDAAWHHFHAYNIRIYDSLLVGFGPRQSGLGDHRLGELANSGGHRGVILYDGPFELTRVHFADFSTSRKTTVINGVTRDITAMPFGTIGGADKFTNRVRGLTFSPEPFRRVDFTDEIGKGWMDWQVSQSILDIDGSLSGESNAMVVPKHRFNFRGDCVSENSWDAFICPAENYKIGTLLIHDLSPGGTSNFFWFNTIRNNSAESHPSVPEVGSMHVKVNLMRDQNYKIDFENQSGHLRRLMFHTERSGETSPVFEIINLAQNDCRIEGAQGKSSVTAVRNSSTSAYYRQGRTLTVKLVPDHQDGKFNRAIRSYRVHKRILCN